MTAPDETYDWERASMDAVDVLITRGYGPGNMPDRETVIKAIRASKRDVPRDARMTAPTITEPVGTIEVARRLGVKAATVSQWRYRGLLPEPVLVVSHIPLWEWPTIREWARSTGRPIRDGWWTP